MLRVPLPDGSEVRARDDGAGRPIVVVPGGLEDGSTWWKVSTLLAPRFRVVCLHRRTYRLDLASAAGAEAIRREAEDVAAVARAVGPSALLVGHSSGAVVCLEALAAEPALFSGALVYEPPAVTDLPLGAATSIRDARAALTAGRPARAIRIFLREIVQVPGWVATVAAPFLARSRRYAPFIPRQIDDVESIIALGDRRSAYARIPVPVVLLGGQRSPAHLGQRLDVLHEVLPRAERVSLPRQGHAGHVKAPDEVARVIVALAQRS